jgi:FkbM family methyltransferase
MTTSRRLKERFKSLGETKLWFIVAMLGTMQQSLLNKKLVLIWRDNDGDWINKREGFTIYSPVLNVDSMTDIQNRVDDLWLHQYKIQDSDIIFDVGAGIGDDLIYLSKLCSDSGKIYAIEANPITYRCLRKTIKGSKLKNVHPMLSACTDKVCTIKISKSRENHLGNNIFSTTSSNDFEEVQGMPIDLMIEMEKIKKVNFLKMNIEGAELIALKGATELMRSGTSFVVSCHDFKYHEGQGDFFKTFDDVKKLLSANNLSTYSRDHDQRREVPYYLYAK